MKQFIFILIIFVTIPSTRAQQTYVPDDNFEQALIDLGYDDTLDDYVLTANISGVTSLDVSEKEISYLTGIEDFTALTTLYCQGNQLTSLDVSSNTALTELHCQGNQLAALDMSSNSALTYLQCFDNQLTSLDVSNNTVLDFLNCGNNQLTDLDVSNNTALTDLRFFDNQLTSLDVTANTDLTGLSCEGNDLTSLDVSNNTALTILGCAGNQLTSLDVSNNTALIGLSCQDNQLTSLDLSNNTALGTFECTSNQITALDVSNNIELSWFKCGQNQLTSLDVSSNPNLNFLICSHNQMTSLDVGSNTALTYLNCGSNQLTSLDVGSNTALTYLQCSTNQLTYLNMRNGITDQLSNFNATDNSLTCIETLDLDYATTNWTSDNENIDAGVTFSVICGSANQDEWYVATTGSDGGGSGTQESPFATIQTGINASGDGNTVHVATGTYVENINFNGKNISVIGENRETTIIDGGADTTFNDASGVVVFNSGETSAALLDGFTIQNGTGFRGGGLLITASPTIENLIIKNNSALAGGGVHIFTGDPNFNNVDFLNNVSTVDYDGYSIGQVGGALSVANGSQSIFTNCTFAGNQSGGYGGGAYVEGAYPDFIHVNFYGNNSTSAGGGGLVLRGSTVDVINSIFWSNNPEQILFQSGGDANLLTVAYSNIQGGQDSIVTNNNGTVTWGSGNIDVNPMFVDSNNGNYHLLASSMLINAGHPDSTDSDGTRADIGAYPYLNNCSGPIWYVSGNGNDTTGTGCGSNSFRSIQAAINFASNGHDVSVASGNYFENINFRGRAIVVNGTGTSTIDGGGNGTVVTFDSGEDETTVLNGFIIQNGSGTDAWPYAAGGILCNDASPKLEDLVIEENSGTYAGGILLYSSEAQLNNLIITNNSSSSYSGGIYTDWSNPVMNNLVITNNTGGGGGGISLNNYSSPQITNTIISDNITNDNSGGVWCGNHSNPTLINVTIANNVSNNSSTGGAVTAYGSDPTLINCITFNNFPNEIVLSYLGDGSSVSVSYSNIQDGLDSIVTNNNGTVTWGSGNIDVNPMFVDSDNGNYHLLASSMLINAGHLDSTDSDGTRADMGAYPYLNNYSGPDWFISESGNDTTATGASGNPFRSIQAGINFSSDADSVTVAAGTYVENINFRGRNIKVVGADWETTIIDGNQSGSVVTFINEEDSTALLRNFTVTNGTGSLFDNSIMGGGILIGSSTHPKIENILITGNSAADGGGIYIFHNSTPILSNLTITNNVAVSGGGGINFQGCSPILINSTISNNTAGDGGGIRGHSSNVIIDNVSIIGNSSAANGGGLIFDDGSNPTLTDVNISSNTASGNGGGMYLNQSNPTQTNVTISENTATVDGGGVYLKNNSSPVMSHLTMSGNTCENNGGGVFMKNNSNPSFSNSILWNDLPQEIYMEGSGGGEPNNATINHTNIQGGQDGIVPNDNGTITWGDGNINLNPLFCSTDNNDYTLDSNSPCLGMGLNGDDMGAHGVGCDRIVWHVSTSGSDVDDGNPGSPFASIQEGINAGSDGDTILVEAGTYVEPNVPYYGNGYSAGPNLYEKNNLAIIADPIGSVIIDLDDHNYGFCFSKSSTNNIVDGFTIRNSGSEMITAWNNSSDNTFMNCVFLATDGEDFTYTTYDPGHIILNCTFIGDGTNQTIYNPVEDGAVPTVLNAIVYNYDKFIGSSYVDDVPINNSLFHEVGGTLPTGGDVIYRNPLFCEADSGNYQLAANSPAVGTGINGWNMGALDVGCDDIWLPPIITTTLVDTSIDEDSEFSLWVSAESEQGYWIYGEAFSDTSSVNVMWSDPEMEDLNIVPMSDWNGTALITLVAYCEFDNSAADTASFTLTVNPVDDLPFVDGHIYPRYYSEDFGVDTVAYLPDVFVDIDGELTFSYTFTDSSILTADLSNNHLVLSSIDDFSGDTELMITATNPTRASVTDTVQISVWPVNDPPVIDSIPDIVMDEDSEFFFDLSSYINDIDSDEIWVFVDNVSAPMNDYVDMYMAGPDTLRLIAYDNWHGTGTITIIADDGDLSDSEEINVTVNPVNDLPVFETFSALVNVGMEFHVPINVSDIDMDSLVVSFDDSWTYPDWLSLVYDPHSLAGTAPEPVDIHFPLNLSDGQVTVTDTFYLSAAFFNPRVTSVTDVPDDQGGRVYASFNASFFDNGETTGQSYSLFRYDYFDSDTSGWVALSSVDAIGDPSYTFEATTVMDSTSEGDGMTEFKVVASMSEGIFHSDPMMGYSVDNIAPGVPGGLVAMALDEGIHLTWDVSVEEDFQYFILEKSLSSEFQEYETFETIDTSYIDLEYVLNETNYYRLAAVDHAGNVSEYSDVVEAAVLSIDGDLIPEVFALHQNYPNPFNPTTQIRYDLPEDANVNITIYDIMGRVVRTMVNTQQNAGFKSIQWNATNNLGEPVSAGMYIYMIQAGEFRQTKKMVLLK